MASLDFMYCKYVFPLCGLHILFLMMFSDEQKFLIFVKSCLSVFCFMVNGFYVLIKKCLFSPRLWSYYSTLSSRSFIVLPSPFRSTLHLELIFVSIWDRDQDFFYLYEYLIDPATFIEKAIIFPLMRSAIIVINQMSNGVLVSWVNIILS